jgi:hypothetical protein
MVPPEVAKLELDALLVELLAGVASDRGSKYTKESHGQSRARKRHYIKEVSKEVNGVQIRHKPSYLLQTPASTMLLGLAS